MKLYHTHINTTYTWRTGTLLWQLTIFDNTVIHPCILITYLITATIYVTPTVSQITGRKSYFTVSRMTIFPFFVTLFSPSCKTPIYVMDMWVAHHKRKTWNFKEFQGTTTTCLCSVNSTPTSLTNHFNQNVRMPHNKFSYS
jgi:hypothetical protein